MRKIRFLEFYKTKTFLLLSIPMWIGNILLAYLVAEMNDLRFQDLLIQFNNNFISWPIFWLIVVVYFQEVDKIFLTPSQWNEHIKNISEEGHTYNKIRPHSLYDLISPDGGEEEFGRLKQEFLSSAQNQKLFAFGFGIYILVMSLWTHSILTTGQITHNGITIVGDLKDEPLLLLFEFIGSFFLNFSYLIIVTTLGGIFLSLRYIANLSKHVTIQPLQNLNTLALHLENSASLEEREIFQEYATFSYRKFRRNAKAISDLSLKVMLGGTFCFFIFNIWLLRTVSALEDNGQDFVKFLLIAFDGIFLILIILMFFYPQKSVNTWLKNAKTSLIRILDEIHEDRLSKYFARSNTSTNVDSKELVDEIIFLEHQITSVDHLLTWPFNYKQVGALVISIFSSGLTFIIPLILRFV